MNFLKQGGGQVGLSQEMRNSINNVKKMLNCCNGNINALISQVSAQSPQAAQIFQAAHGGNPKAIVEEICRQRGIDFDEFIRAIQN